MRAAGELRPDLVLMDIRMPGIDGIEATRRIVADRLCEVLVLTTFDLDDLVDGALAAGAAGFLLKSVAARQLLDAARAVARGDGVLAPEITRPVLARLAGPARRPSPAGIADLTPRETDVLGCLGRGQSNAGIAAPLVITEATTKTHVSRAREARGALAGAGRDRRAGRRAGVVLSGSRQPARPRAS